MVLRFVHVGDSTCRILQPAHGVASAPRTEHNPTRVHNVLVPNSVSADKQHPDLWTDWCQAPALIPATRAKLYPPFSIRAVDSLSAASILGFLTPLIPLLCWPTLNTEVSEYGKLPSTPLGKGAHVRGHGVQLLSAES